MRLAALALLLVVGFTTPSSSMNWEGHDDWMRDHPAAVIFESVVPPLPRKRLPCVPASEIGKVPAHNVYEQVPLAHRACPPGKSGADDPASVPRD